MKNQQKIVAKLEQENEGAIIAGKNVLDSCGGPFGKGLGRVSAGVWRPVGSLKTFLGVIFSCLYWGWSSEGLLEASGLDFGSIFWGLDGIWGGFREGLGEGFRRILGCSGLFWIFLVSWGAFG